MRQYRSPPSVDTVKTPPWGALLVLVRLQRQEPGSRISWVVRAATPTRLSGAGKADRLPARGALGGGGRDAVQSGAGTLLAGTTIDALRSAVGRSRPPGADATIPTVGPAGPDAIGNALTPVNVSCIVDR